MLKDVGFDIVDMVDIILELEKNVKITIPDEVQINKVGDFVEFVAYQAVKEAS